MNDESGHLLSLAGGASPEVPPASYVARMGRILWIAMLAALVGCGGSEQPSDVPTDEPFPFLNRTAEFVGSESCADCHADYWSSYQSHGMARSLYALTPETTVERFDGTVVRDDRLGFSYRAYREDDRFFQEEYRLDAAGNRTHRLVREMQYVVGSGSAARTYLVEVEGRYVQLPLTWYTQDGGRWDFSPGYRERNARFDRIVPDRCMTCHTGTHNRGETLPVGLADGLFEGLAQGIGCEQCHGPGSVHVDARLLDDGPAQGPDYTIVNPKHLSLDRRLDVCQQCHLNGTVSLLREGREAFDFRPGEPLTAHVALFNLDTEAEGAIAVISHADRMRLSACFTESLEASRPMDCVTCHNPHEGFRDAGPDYFNRTCMSCHAVAPLQDRMPTPELAAQHDAAVNCFACHMPRVPADDAPHSSFTDHHIRVVRGDRVTGQVLTARDVRLEPYFARDREGPEAAVYAAMAEVVYGRQEGRRDVLARGADRLASALDAASHLGEAQFLLGWARLQLGQAAQAVAPLERSLERNRHPERLNALAQALETLGRDPVRTEALYREAVTLQPNQPDVQVNLGRFLEAQGRLAEAIGAYEAAVAAYPWHPEARYNLGTALLRMDRPGDALAHLDEAVRLRPDDADALLNLGILRASRGETEAAGRLFRRATEADPANANAWVNLGTFHLQRGAFREAAAAYDRALTAAPGAPDALAGRAAAALQLGDAASARRFAEQAPGHPLARQVLDALR